MDNNEGSNVSNAVLFSNCNYTTLLEHINSKNNVLQLNQIVIEVLLVLDFQNTNKLNSNKMSTHVG